MARDESSTVILDEPPREGCTQENALPKGGGSVVSAHDDTKTCGCSAGQSTGAPPAYVYAIGRIEARFASLSSEKEFAQVVGREKPDDTKGVPDQSLFHKILSDRANRYLGRQLCWVFTVQGLETYLLIPRDPLDLDLLIEAIRPAKSPMDMDIVIGVRGQLAPSKMCNGLMVPIVGFDHIYSFDRDALIASIPKPEKAGKEFAHIAGEVLDRILDMTDNAGASDEHRALNYMIVRDPGIYRTTASAYARNCSLTSVDAGVSALSGTRKIVDVILTFTERSTDVAEKFCGRVDVTEEFPFLVKKISPYYDR